MKLLQPLNDCIFVFGMSCAKTVTGIWIWKRFRAMKPKPLDGGEGFRIESFLVSSLWGFFFFFMRLPTNPVCPIYPFTATAQYILIRNRLQVLLKLAQTQVKCCHFLDCFIPSICSLIDTNMCAFVVQFSEGEAEGKTAICSILYFMNRQS